MASTVINYRYPLTGQTLTLLLRGDSASASPSNGAGGDAFTESGTESGFYSATVTEALSGVLWWQVTLSGAVVDQGWVRIADDVGPYLLNDQMQRASEGNSVTILADTDELQQNQGDWATADTSGLATATNVSDAQAAIQEDIAGLNNFNPATDVVARVTLVDTTTTNSDMRGTDGANTTTPPSAATIASQVRTELTTELERIDAAVSSRLATAGYTAPDNASITQILDDTANAIPALIDALNDPSAATIFSAVLNTQMTESYAAAGAAPTLAQAIFMIHQHLCDAGIVDTTKTVYKVDGTTPAGTFTLNDGSTPTAIERAT